MEFELALEHALDGHAVLFTGAGFSRDAVNLRGDPLKNGRELALHLSKLANLPEDTTLDDAAEEFTQLRGEDLLVSELKQEFTVKDIASSHLHIAEVPWRRIYTTNYDNVLETAYTRNSRLLVPIVQSDNIRTIPIGDKANTLCIHLNGYVDRLTRENLWSEIKLTDTSYLTATIADSPWASLFRQDLSIGRAVFFVGYSLTDMDIRRLLFDSPPLIEKCFFVLGADPDEATRRRASRFGTILPMDTDAFATAIKEKSCHYSPPDFAEHIGYSVKKFNIEVERPLFSDQFIFDLLLSGDHKSGFIWDSLHGGPRYYLERPNAVAISERLDAGDRFITVHSELGNGKTLLLEGVKCLALEKGYDVYTVSIRTDNLFRELDQVLQSTDKTLIVVDDYPDWFDVIQHFSINANPASSLLLASRSSVHDVMIDRLCEILQRESLPEYSADHLSDPDIGWITDFFDEYGLWAEKAAWSRTRKTNFLKVTCRGEFCAILIKLLESPQIASRFDRILNELNKKHDYYEVVITILILTVIHHVPHIDTLVDIWGQKILDTQFKRNPTISQLIDFSGGQIRLRSAVAAQFVLKKVADVNLIVEALIVMARSIDNIGRVSSIYGNLLRNLMRFTNLQNLFPEQQRRPAIIRYYESIKNLHACRGNPQFWLQYAIACLVLGEYQRSESYFRTAYSLAEARDYDTFQIDNHYARFLLVTAIDSRDSTKCMLAFRKAREILNEQMKQERMHYPYRVAASYGDFYETFAPMLELAQRDEIAQSATFVAKRIEALPADRRMHRSVSDCYKAMRRILELEATAAKN